ncbi:enolase-like protein eno4 [Plakobranchus ocellatus]|uniref:Enolase 4 n=1 Tax=Plakobranchus ocellatus TaxID=259542 RepID=A0AAV4C953_9GAST|nr:enolase-like protein eno4 [Plakobranchus ocellatus]
MASASSSRHPKDAYALKQKAMKYYNENGIPLKMEEILNKMFYDDPTDVHGYLVNYFSQFAKEPLISKLCASKVFDATGMPTIQTDVFCTVNNKEKKIVSSTLPFTNIKAKPEDFEKAEVEIQNSMATAIKAINTEISKLLEGRNPKEQSEIDELTLSVIEKMRQEESEKKAQEEETNELASPTPATEEKDKKKSAKGKGGKQTSAVIIVPDRPLEVFTAGSEAVAAVSQAVCACAAVSHSLPIYRHVAKLARTSGALHEFRVPLPMVTIIHSGKFLPGKVNCVKEYMLVPGVSMPVEKSIEFIQHIFHYVEKSLATKLGEAVNAQGLTIGEDMYLAINAGGHDFFDHEKGRYEVVAGSNKSPDEMVEFWADVILKYPALVALIDPLRGEDIEQWLKLGERISDGVFLIGDRFYSRPGLLHKSLIETPIQTSGAVLYLEQMNSISDLVQCCNLFHEMSNEVVISTNQSETTDTFIVDFAVGLNARFLKMGGASRGERACKLNRLVQISKELEPSKPTQEPSPHEAEHGDEATDNEKTDNKEEDPDDKKISNDELKINISKNEQEEAEKKEMEAEVPKEEVSPQLWGEDEKSCQKLHTPFTFPVIQVPPPPEDSQRDGEEIAKPGSPASKNAK